jgi:hypothetical protein
MARPGVVVATAKLITPPIILKAVKVAFNSASGGRRLFDGDSRSFERVVASAKVYAEYGVGMSTDYVASRYNIPIIAVDTSKEWVDLVRSRNGIKDHIQIAWVDVGPLGDWGRPINYSYRDRFLRYIQSVWSTEYTPDVVLVDGRFRVACFLQSLLSGPPGTTIVFDDYANRPHYHLIEEFLSPFERCGRQALFRIPTEFDRRAAQAELARFTYVMD